MANTAAILKAAADLGELIAEHDAAAKLKTILDKLREDTEAQRVLNDFHRHAQTVAEKEAKNEPIEVEDKRKLADLQGAMATNPILRDLQLRQMDYMDLMRQVDAAIEGAGGTPIDPDVQAPGIVAPGAED